jgi:4'-phosphopantetheinyl transferase
MIVDVWWARRDNASSSLVNLLDETERQRWQAYRREEDRDRFLVGCAVAKAAVAQVTGADPVQVRFDRTCPQCGKPHGKPSTKGAEFSVSHSGGKIVVAVTESVPVGVDVEEIRETRDSAALAAYVLAETESSDGFFTTWARKEAVTKATGDGLRVPFREVVVTAPSAAPGLVSWPYPLPPSTVTLFDLDPGPGYAAALAVLDSGLVDVCEHDAAALPGGLAR